MPEYQFLDISKLLHCGVYCLLRRGEVVYVGKSKNPIGRLEGHIRNRNRDMSHDVWRIGNNKGNRGPTHNGRGINFDGIHFYPCMLGQLDVIEAVLIKKFLPKYNTKGMPKQALPEDIKDLLAQMGWMSFTPPPLEDRPKVYIRRML